MDGASAYAGDRRLSIRVVGQVQGVGFRPHVHRVATSRGVRGFVLNDADGVLIEAQGAELGAFLDDLASKAPRLARIAALRTQEIPPRDDECGFDIQATVSSGAVSTVIPPDAAICDPCLQELFDPTDRRHLHPFISCADCGPRYTITRTLPYDRAQTSMADFPMCAYCAAEYADPASRRFHAEPISCTRCGPTLSEPVEKIADCIRGGGIVALKGLGGFHLMCDGRDPAAVARLRAGKQRDGKPFAIMCLNLASARRLGEIDAVAAAALESHERPILVLDAVAGNGVAPGVSNELPSLGVMLAYTPLHYLLFHALLGGPEGAAWLDEANALCLVATSGNRSGDPLVIDDATASEEFNGVADLVAGHDRAIVTRADDSVGRIIAGGLTLIRRSRGFAPNPIPLEHPAPTVLALGGALKTTVCLLNRRQALVSQHVGDLETAAARAFLRETAAHLLAIADRRPERVACDAHPDFFSTQLAHELAEQFDAPLIRVQHHHAHIAAVAGEHGHRGPVLGLALDGYGMGANADGMGTANAEAWGGELLLVDGPAYRRLGHLAKIAQPGGDVAAREPWRMAAAALARLGRPELIVARFADEALAAPVARLLASGHAPETSSAGRYFDAAAALLGVVHRSTFEGDAAMRLEALARTPRSDPTLWSIESGVLCIDRLMEKLAEASSAVEGANLFHGTLAAGLVDWSAAAARETGVRAVALGGGCFLNRRLTELVCAGLAAKDLTPLLARRLPPNDGGLSFGQAIVASHTSL